jgi:hypothetical protein
MKYNIVYEIRGSVERSCVFKVNKASVRVNFEGGAISSRGTVPAQFATTQVAIQKAIESSSLYKSGVITKGSVYEMEEESDSSSRQEILTSTVGEDGCTDYPGVANMQQAKEVLMAEPFNISLADLQNKDAVKAKANELKVSFSNWK